MADNVFTGSVPRVYDAYFVPLLFEYYAADLARRVAGARTYGSVLEVAAGTGVVTRSLAALLPTSTAIVATDLNPGMIEQAREIGTTRPVEWRQADVMRLPFEDEAFDAVVCQFGVMFFPGKARAFTEIRRVLRPGGTFFFNTWDRLADNELAEAVDDAIAAFFAHDPPHFMARTPHGYFDLAAIARDLANGGFTMTPQIETVAARSRAASAEIAALAFCQGTPLRGEIETRDPKGIDAATAAAARAIAARFGPGPVDGKMQAHVIAIER